MKRLGTIAKEYGISPNVMYHRAKVMPLELAADLRIDTFKLEKAPLWVDILLLMNFSYRLKKVSIGALSELLENNTASKIHHALNGLINKRYLEKGEAIYPRGHYYVLTQNGEYVANRISEFYKPIDLSVLLEKAETLDLTRRNGINGEHGLTKILRLFKPDCVLDKHDIQASVGFHISAVGKAIEKLEKRGHLQKIKGFLVITQKGLEHVARQR